jgi:hypothetical protein
MLTVWQKGERTPHEDDDFDFEMNAVIARAPIRGRGVPIISRNPNVSFQPSELTDVTDLGNHLHELKTQGRVLPFINQSDPKEPLQDQLIDALHETPGYPEKKGFFPRDLLASLVDEECVVAELRIIFKNVLDDNTV